MYIGPRTTFDGIQYVFFDSEGFSGTPTTAAGQLYRVLAQAAQRTTQSITSAIADAFGMGKRSAESESSSAGISKAFSTARMNHVQNSYPKLLYLFSDVLLFITTHNWREKSLIDSLLLWARKGGGNSVNQPVKPKLIIVFNKEVSS